MEQRHILGIMGEEVMPKKIRRWMDERREKVLPRFIEDI